MLLSFGVPEALLPSVRAVKTQDALLALVKHLPAEAAEALTWLGEGIPVEEVRAAVPITPVKETVNPQGPGHGAGEPRHQASVRHHQVAGRPDLDPQRPAGQVAGLPASQPGEAGRPRSSTARPVSWAVPARARRWWPCTGPGTWLGRSFKEKTDRILFTTFTANLAESVEQNLRSLCGDEMERIEVIHLHAWAVRFMKTQGVDFQVASDEEIDQCWDEALAVVGDPDFDVGFLKQEWALVVQANGITTLPEYLQVHARAGAGRSPSRSGARSGRYSRNTARPCEDKGKQEWLQVIQETRRYPGEEEGNPALPGRRRGREPGLPSRKSGS